METGEMQSMWYGVGLEEVHEEYKKAAAQNPEQVTLKLGIY